MSDMPIARNLFLNVSHPLHFKQGRLENGALMSLDMLYLQVR